LQTSVHHNPFSPPSTEWSPRNNSMSFESGSGPFNATPPEPTSAARESQKYQQKEEALGNHPVLTVNRENKDDPKENEIQKSMATSFMYSLHTTADIEFPFPRFLREEAAMREEAKNKRRGFNTPTNLPPPNPPMNKHK
jgi:hypothetical protein